MSFHVATNLLKNNLQMRKFIIYWILLFLNQLKSTLEIKKRKWNTIKVESVNEFEYCTNVTPKLMLLFEGPPVGTVFSFIL